MRGTPFPTTALPSPDPPRPTINDPGLWTWICPRRDSRMPRRTKSTRTASSTPATAKRPHPCAPPAITPDRAHFDALSPAAAKTAEALVGENMKIPDARGPISGGLFRLLADGTGDDSAAQGMLHDLIGLINGQLALTEDIIDDDDVQLTLFCLYELHYGGLDGVDERWEWNPGLIALRQLLEEPF